ncbi:gluconate:H+ symporter [Priestia filamentosa]|uniref:Gluconate permease n=1 Tax=Priestia filamentosa TaxID=1402861 RepID=A0A1X7GDW3_9BACI|nr:gluconate:H+ symporter [Priestia filamentosa]AKO90875.1 gluconate permease [Priestia filamentosa]AVD54218.1 gluconate permease [Priestia filamentosa]MDT3766040.1 gluconate:H+ symporter [Priestia filamentosa]OXS65357.1 gluconate permease [Priestia filamentosa]RJS65775.1 gluconate permease [Priestia filamentosa]
MPIVIICIGVALLLLLITVFRLNAFISLIIVSILVGIMEGMAPLEALESVKDGLGATLGDLALVLGFGTMLGKLMADSGGAQRIADTLIAKFGENRVQLATVITAFVVGIALFYETGFIVLIPLVFTVAISAGLPVLYIGMPVVAALITVHGFVPPHPGPTAIAVIFHANIGKMLLVGILTAIPAVLIGGVLYTKMFKKENLQCDIPKELFNPKKLTDKEMPGFGVSVFTSLIPVILMFIHAFVEIFFPKSPLLHYIGFIGDPAIALLIAVLLGIFTFGLHKGKTMDSVMKTITESITSIAMILLIIGGGGAFKQILIDSKVDQYIAHLMEGTNLSPLLLTWLIAAILRVSLGSATVAGLTAAGIAAPLVNVSGVSPELMALAAGAGSITFSHVNDAGFWIYKEYFNLSIGQTIKTWSVMVTIISLVGLGCVLLLNVFM